MRLEMYIKLFLGLYLAILTVVTTPIPLMAQSKDASELSAEELKTLFSKQKTRGLVLAPTNTENSATANAENSEAQPTKPNQTYVELAPEEQVNIQVTFDFDSSALNDDQKPKLATLCSVMKGVDVEVFRIVGHTDASGAAGYNKRLSLLRAQEVKRYLINDCGVEEKRLEAVGVGEEFPADKADPRGDVNRRVEFQALS